MNTMTTELWPPLSLIRSNFERDAAPAPASAPTETVILPGGQAAAGDARRSAEDLLLPLTELARRREAVAQRGFTARWAPGRLVSVLHEGRLLGVLLDKCVHDDLWQGWMAASEVDWAGAFDVLLEPGDEPFEPQFGLIQTWNSVTVQRSPRLCARVLGEVSATRLAAIRATADESAAQAALDIAPEPGRIALRTVGEVFSVLSGTPLAAEQDPRADYQALYARAAAELRAAAKTAPPAALSQAQQEPAGGWWTRMRQSLFGESVLRPAFAVLALVVVVQNVGLLRTADDEEVRFRSAPVPAAPAPADLTVRWKAGVDIGASAQLLRSLSAEVVGGPDAQGGWRIRLSSQPAEGRAALAASPLVESVSPP
jgi:hypothetical protein